MCHGLAPGFVLRDEIAEELLEEARAEAEASGSIGSEDATAEGTPSFAVEDDPAGEAITGGATDRSDRPTGGPK